MKPSVKVVILFLLLTNAVAATFGGIKLMLDSSGSSIQLSLDLLRHTYFSNYFIPGMVLFVTNGLFGLYAATATLFNLRNAHFFVIAQGLILCGWIIIQVFLIDLFHTLHAILGLIGVLLVILGFFQLKLFEKADQQI